MNEVMGLAPASLALRVRCPSSQSAQAVPKAVQASCVLETLTDVRDKKNRASIFNRECQRAAATKMALCLPHGAETQGTEKRDSGFVPSVGT